MLRDTLQPVPLKQQNGILYLYDSSRSKWISSARSFASFGINHRNVKSIRWMSLTGEVKSPQTGYRLPRNAVITAVTVQLSQSGSATFKLQKNSTTTLHSITLTSQSGLTQDNLNIDININDFLQCKIEPAAGGVSYPLAIIELGWKL